MKNLKVLKIIQRVSNSLFKKIKNWLEQENKLFYFLQPQTFTLTNLSGVKPRQDLGQNGVEDMIQLR